MPAVSSFALYAGAAVLADFALQVTAFPALLVLDERRRRGRRLDCLPCIQLSDGSNSNETSSRESSATGNSSFLEEFVRRVYAPVLLHSWTRGFVLFLGACTLGLALFHTFSLERGLDQTIALPMDSHLQAFFRDFADYFSVGPPLFFVVRGGAKDVSSAADVSSVKDVLSSMFDASMSSLLSPSSVSMSTSSVADVSSVEGQRALASRFWVDASPWSLGAMLEVHRQLPEAYIADSAASWLDDYYAYLYQCAALEDDSIPLPEHRWLNESLRGAEFMRHLPAFLATPPTPECMAGGQAAYANAVVLGPGNASVVAHHFRTFHRPLRTQEDYIRAMEAGQAMARLISQRNAGLDVYAYSLFYVFFEQYLALWVLSLALSSIFVLTLGVLGSAWTALLVTATITSLVLHVSGSMALWGITLNAVSLVNLVIAAGIAIEFCSHLARAYLTANGKDRVKRTDRALGEVGVSVVSGIGMTKLIGVSVLTLAPSQIFHVSC